MRLKQAKRIVIKIGSMLLVDAKSGQLHKEWLDSVIDDVAELYKQGKEIIIVSSGSVALGRRHLHLESDILKLEEKQAAAACGQVELMQHYQQEMARFNITTAQLLLSLQDSEDRRRYLNARETIETLLSMRAIPVINENDTVATAEIRFGDNDRLAARVAQMASADALVLLSDVDGLYTANPELDAKAEFIPEVKEITPEIEAMAGGSVSNFGSGGMTTKVMAAKIATASGCHMAITKGKSLHPIRNLLEGGRCTWFVSKENPISARKHWIAGSVAPVGEIVIDDGAQAALSKGKSLLPAGVTEVSGTFNRGDAVAVMNLHGQEVGRGLIAYTNKEAACIIGRKTHEIEEILGFSGRSALIHSDDLVFTGKTFYL